MFERKRQGQRLKFQVEGTVAMFGINGKEHQRTVVTENISVAGLYLVSETPSYVGDHVLLRLKWPSTKEPPQFIASVIRVDRLNNNAYGLALRFEETVA